MYNNKKPSVAKTRPSILFLIYININVAITSIKIVFVPKKLYKNVEGIIIPSIEI